MLTLTRGEGGQNLMSADFNDALGLIRTQELLAEDRYTGTDQFFGTEVDFGFSKTKEESFRKWTHERVLYDAVRAVRLYRPLVLASVFIGGVTDGHGQHQVSGEIAQEVFLAAADPKVFPEMGLPPWAPLRVYARVPFARITAEGMFDYATGKYLPPSFHNYVTGTDTTKPPVATVTIHEGEVPNIPAFNGLSYAQWARQGLALQKTQIGPNFHPPTGGRSDSGYTLYGSREECGKSSCPVLGTAPSSLGRVSTDAEDDLFTGIDTSFASLANLAPSAPKALSSVLTLIDNQTTEAQKLFNPAKPELTAAPLRLALKLLDDLIRDTDASTLPQIEKFNLMHELRVKRVQFNNALVLALGLSMTVRAETSEIAKTLDSVSFPSHELETTWHIKQSGTSQLEFLGPSFSPAGVPVSGMQPKKFGTDFIMKLQISLQESAIPTKKPLATRPYFYRHSVEQPYYDIENPNLRNAPATPGPMTALAFLRNEGVDLILPAKTIFQDAAMEFTPSISVDLSSSAGIVSVGHPTFTLYASISNKGNASVTGKLSVEGTTSWKGSSTSSPFHADAQATFHATPITFIPVVTDATASAIFRATATTAEASYTESFRPVGYPGLTYTNYYTPATYSATAVDVTTATNLRIAYLPGTGDDVPQFLPSLGVTPTILSVKDLTLDSLKQYDAILLGVRVYSAHPEFQGSGSDALTEYAKQGGIVIVQYNSAGFNPASAPYPYTVPGDSAHNVVEEEHPVAILQPENPLLTWPNRIVPADFDHWIEERGHGFATDWSPEYTPLLEMHDDGQDPQKGGLLVAKVGKGAYIYCALALYRQLPEGVPGAYRLLANLLSYAKNPNR
jgi:hypothetical protein